MAAVPACTKHFGASSRMEASSVPSNILGKDLSKHLYAAALEADVPVPRARRSVHADVLQHGRRCVLAQDLPVDARLTWYEAVHDILPTASGRQAGPDAGVPPLPGA